MVDRDSSNVFNDRSLFNEISFGPVAQLVRASDCRSEGCEFESHQDRMINHSLISILSVNE